MTRETRKSWAAGAAGAFVLYVTVYIGLSVRGAHEVYTVENRAVEFIEWRPAGLGENAAGSPVLSRLFRPLHYLDVRFWHRVDERVLNELYPAMPPTDTWDTAHGK